MSLLTELLGHFLAGVPGDENDNFNPVTYKQRRTSTMDARELKYSKTHEWIRYEGEEAVIGISDYAQSELGDLAFLPEMPVDPVLFHRDAEHPAGALAVDVPPVMEDISPPFLIRQV